MDLLLVNITGLAGVVILLWGFNIFVRDPWNYANLFSVVYGFGLIGCQVWYSQYGDDQYRLTSATVLVFFGAWWAVLVGSLAVIRRLIPPRPFNLRILNRRRSIISIGVLLLLNWAYNFAAMASNGTYSALLQSGTGVLDALAANRVANAGDLTKGDVPWYLEIWHLSYLYYMPLAVYVRRFGWISKGALIFLFALSALSSFILFSRIQFLELAVVTFVSWVVLFDPKKITVIYGFLLGVSFCVFLFVSIQYFLFSNALSSTTNFKEQIATYAFSSFSSYQEILRGGYSDSNLDNTFYTLQAPYFFLVKAGILEAAKYPIGYREYVFVPYPSNIYTFIDAFTLDFGIFGAFVGAFFIGVGVSLMYRNLRRGKGGYSLLTIYAISVFACISAILANIFITPVFVIQIVTIWLIGRYVEFMPRSVQFDRPNRL